jgi:hypothetical protein
LGLAFQGPQLQMNCFSVGNLFVLLMLQIHQQAPVQAMHTP